MSSRTDLGVAPKPQKIKVKIKNDTSNFIYIINYVFSGMVKLYTNRKILKKIINNDTVD